MDNLAADFSINPSNPLNAEYEINEGNSFDCSFELFAAGTVWGSIDGDINNQSDLVNILNNKVDVSSFEDLSQTVTNNYNELSSTLTALTVTVGDNYTELDGRISALSTTVNNNYSILDNRLDTAEGSILNLTDTVNDNYADLDGRIITTNNNLNLLSQTVEDNNTAINNRVDGIVVTIDDEIEGLDDRITTNADNITSINNTITNYGDIVTYNAANFATAAQGALADSALQNTATYPYSLTLLGTPSSYGSSVNIGDSSSVYAQQTVAIGSLSYAYSTKSTALGVRSGADGTYSIAIGYQAYTYMANSAIQLGYGENSIANTLNIGFYNNSSTHYNWQLLDGVTGLIPDGRISTNIARTTAITSLNNAVSDLSSTVQSNYTILDGKIDSTETTLQGNIDTLSGTVTSNTNNISAIQDLIPSQATTSNQLADKSFVNSSIATNTAYFIGTFNSVAELEAYTGTLTNNDYAFVATTDSAGNTLYDRYKWNGSEWLFEYELNNSSFTAAQWSAINSGATSANISQIATNTNDITDLQTNKQDTLTAGANIQINNNVISATDTTYTAGTGISIVNGVVSNTQTSAEWGNIQGTLSNQTDLQSALNTKYDASNPNGYITSADLPTNYVTTDTDQDITGVKTFVGDKRLKFKATNSNSKMGFTAFDSSNREVGYLEAQGNGNASHKCRLGVYDTNSGNYDNVLGFEYYKAKGSDNTLHRYNLLCPPLYPSTTDQSFYIPMAITDGSSTVVADNKGSVDISTLLPDTSNFVTNSSLATTLAYYTLSANLATVATSGSYNDLTNKPTIPAAQVQANWDETDTTSMAYIQNKPTIPTAISDLTDDTSTYPIDKADTLTGLTASIAELNYTDGVTSNIQTQLDDKVNTSDIWYDSSTSTLYIGVSQS